MIYRILCVCPTTSLRSFLSQRSTGPFLLRIQTPWEKGSIYTCSMSPKPHRPHLKPRIAVKRYAPELQRKDMYDTCLPWLFMRCRILCIGPTRSPWCRRFLAAVPLCYWCDHVTLLPNTFPPQTFVTSFGRTTYHYCARFAVGTERPFLFPIKSTCVHLHTCLLYTSPSPRD